MKSKNYLKRGLLLMLLSFVMVVDSYSKTYVITISGGRGFMCGATCGVCYDFVQIKDSETQYSKTCEGRGPNCCPKTGIVTVGSANLNVDGVEETVKQQVLSGNNSGTTILYDISGNQYGYYTWSGSVNTDGEVDCIITIEIA